MSACLICLDPGAPDPPALPYHEQCLERLFRVSQPPRIPFDRATLPSKVEKLIEKFSISGVQPKARVELSKDRSAIEVVERGGAYILKPQAMSHPHVPENEHLSMALARLAGLPVPENGLFALADGSLAYIIKRFDRTDAEPAQKRGQIDFCALAGLRSGDKYDSSAERCAKLLHQYAPAPDQAARLLFRQWLLSYWIGNGDLHLKNLSLLEGDDGTYGLSPTYDIISTWLYGDRELAMPISGKKTKVTRKNWLDFAETHCRIPRPEAQALLDGMLGLREAALALVDRSALPDPALKESYRQVLEERGAALAGSADR